MKYVHLTNTNASKVNILKFTFLDMKGPGQESANQHFVYKWAVGSIRMLRTRQKLWCKLYVRECHRCKEYGTLIWCNISVWIQLSAVQDYATTARLSCGKTNFYSTRATTAIFASVRMPQFTVSKRLHNIIKLLSPPGRLATNCIYTTDNLWQLLVSYDN